MIDHDEFDPETLRYATAYEQRDGMEEWFRSRFEDPAQRTPYESAEGGYIWVWGGPFDAEEELRNEFEGIVPDAIIEDLAASLGGECPEWAPVEHQDDYDAGLFEAVSANARARQTLDDGLGTIRTLLAVPVPSGLDAAYRRLLFANAIAAMETYLSDTFINRVFGDPQLLQLYIDTEPKFSSRKVPYKDILREAKHLETEARKELLDVVWHNIGKVKAMYAQVLGVDLGDLDQIAGAIQLRHDIVHRNGRTKDGTIVEVSAKDILLLLNEIAELAARVEIRLDFGIDGIPDEILDAL
jgi:hypothetical protein